MRCAQCKQMATGVCQFCGRGVCAGHRDSRRFVSGWNSRGSPRHGIFARDHADAIVVDDANWCGLCQVTVDHR